MKKSIKVDQKKGRGRPATGRGVMISSRVPDDVATAIEDWAARYGVTRSSAVRRLVELGLTAKAKSHTSSDSQKARARETAGRAIDGMTDDDANAEDQAGRKRRLLKGPEEFREVRVDRKKAKPK